ncbi:hypothetical protein J2Z48_001205 [Croceifilum oryzae]|uniref:Uncharacterized protein n=1 Tax=Croceifilum oryzae TaxID=1553429 RepID=A0AAJ1TDW7_9BACL|nr:DUF6585 family protein [Croceifilum oryzae]MDQ0417033.1 hypothetical protein [Croceifilum oryzae]
MVQYDDSQLGDKGKLYSVNKGKVLTISLLYGFVAILMSAGCVYFTWKAQQGKADVLLISQMIATGMCGLFGFVMMLWKGKDLSEKVRLYQNGIIVFGRKKEILLPYSRMDRIYWNIRSKRKWSGKEKTIHTLSIDSLDYDEEISLSSKRLVGAKELMEQVERGVSSWRLDILCETLSKGEEIHFDDVSLHIDYVRIPDGYINWSNFGGITLQNGMVYLINKQDEPFYGVKLSKFPNFSLFTNVTQHICEQHEQQKEIVV